MPDVPVLAQAQGPAGAEAAATGGKRRIPWLFIVIGVAVLAVGVGAALFLTHASSRAHGAKTTAHKPSGPPLYLALDPPFVVNFQADQLVRFLQVSVEVMSRDPATLDLLKSNDPVVRNDLLILFANQKYTVISTPAGKEQLRADALAAIRKDLAQTGGDPNKLEAVYFTSFVMQ
jgi:flagellar protein FliL